MISSKRAIQILTPVFLGVMTFLFFNATTPLNYELHNSGNLVRNGSFERFSLDGIPVNWTSKCKVPVSNVRNVGIRDKSSALLNDNSAGNACGLMSDFFPVEAGKTYRIEASARWDSLDAPQVYIYFYKNQTKLSSKAYRINKGANTWSPLSTSISAPSGANRAQVYLYSPIARTGKTYFDGIAFYEKTALPKELILYAGPVATGSGSGTSTKNWAKYNDPTFWNKVKTYVSSRHVKVILKAGTYSIASTADRFLLKKIGHPIYRLTIEGQAAFGTTFLFPSSATVDPGVLISLDTVQNTLIRHIHFRSQAKVELGYLMTILRSKNISLSGITAINLPLVKYGVFGPHQGTTNLIIREAEMIKLGYDSHQHFIYANRNIQNLHLTNSILEDSTGSFFRCRDVCDDLKISDSDFYATGTWGNHDNYRSAHFFELAVFNDQLWNGKNASQQEWFGGGVTASNNTFRYELKSGNAIPFSIVHTGYNPWDGDSYREHLINAKERDVLLNDHVTSRRNLIFSKYKLDLRKKFTVLSNRFSGHKFLFELQSGVAYGADKYYAPSEYAGSGTYDISSCLMQ